MDIKKLKKLIELVETSNISALCLEEDNTKIEIKKESTTQVIQTAVQPTVQAAPAVLHRLLLKCLLKLVLLHKIQI